MKFIVYTGAISSEVIVTTKERDVETLNKYFTGDLGRNLEEYSRDELDCVAVVISSDVVWEV